MKYVISIFEVFIVPVLIGFGLYSIEDKHFGFTNVCYQDFYPDLCGVSNIEEKKE